MGILSYENEFYLHERTDFHLKGFAPGFALK